ncbi:MAG: glycosyltransferase [Saprospiraceae bacterium]|nr:glycosyltransferase [Saprospiraceae bacterium]
MEKHRIGDYISIEGWQNEEDFPHYINISHIGLSPLIRNIHHDTTYANKLFQYMAFGLPLLVSDCDAQRNLVINNNIGFTHKANSAHDFVHAVEVLYDDPELRAQMSKACIQTFYTQFKDKMVTKDLQNYYQSISNDF